MARNWQVSCAESCTGGGIAAAITAIPGSSIWFGAGFVVYSNHHKHQLLGVAESSLAEYGAVSEQVAVEMAVGALRRVGAHIAVAVTGIAGPEGGTVEKPVGTVWFAWATQEKTWSTLKQFVGDRQSIRTQSVAVALQGLIDHAKSTV